jgi:large subunit ribosomal protein L10
MERAEKVVFLEKLTDRFGRAPIAVLTDYRGLNVAQITELRRKVRAVDGEYLVAKNNLTRLAVKDGVAGALEAMLKGPTGIAFGFSDAVALAKVVSAFAKENEKLQVKGAVFEGEVLAGARVAQIAAMPGRDELRAQLLALMITPATQLVRVLAAPGQALVQVLDARRRQQEGG